MKMLAAVKSFDEEDEESIFERCQCQIGFDGTTGEIIGSAHWEALTSREIRL